jgi:hypothetical protein
MTLNSAVSGCPYPLKEGGLPVAFGKDRQNTMALPSLIVRLSLVKVGKFPEPFLDRG